MLGASCTAKLFAAIAAAGLGGAADLLGVLAAFAIAASLCAVAAVVCRPANLTGPLPVR